MEKPIVLISACLEFEKVRYNGQSVPSQIIKDLSPFVEYVKVCPEYEIGLGVPRNPIRIVRRDGEQRLVQHGTDRDVTEEMNKFSENFIEKLGEVDGFIFKSKSPTMGVSNIKVYSGMKGSPVVDRCGGFFASKIAEKYGDYPIEEEDRLRNKRIRDHFLTQIFLFADYRNCLKKDDLKNFDKRNKLLFEFYNEKLSKKLDIHKKNYFELIRKIMRVPPSSESIYLFFKKLLAKNEEILLKYKENKISYETLKEVSKFLIKEKDLLGQRFFKPYPLDLLAQAEDDRGKNYWKV